jgi:hypothetical protein
MDNMHSQAIPAEVLAEAQRKIDEVAAALAPYTLSLAAEQRRDMVKMGDKSLAFVSKAHELAGKNPLLRPAYLDLPGFDIDMVDATKLLLLDNALQQLLRAVEDTSMVAGSEAYQAALMFYTSAREAASKNIPGAKAVYDELKARFPRVRRRQEEAEL